MEIAETRRQLHAHYFTEVRTPQADNSQPELRRLMVTEVDRYGVHRNRQPEFFFNGIIGHIRADQNGWIDSWEQATQLANYWRRHFQIPEVYQDGNWYHYPQESNSANQAGESQESLPGSDMGDTDSLVVHAASASAPSQIHQLATASLEHSQQWPRGKPGHSREIGEPSNWPDPGLFGRQTWPTLLATWHRPLATCRCKLNKWKRFPTSAIESDNSGLKVFWATRIPLYFDLALIAISCFRAQIRASLPSPQLPKNSLAAARRVCGTSEKM